MKKKKYIIVDETTISELERAVGEQMDAGYLPTGGMFYQSAQYKEIEIFEKVHDGSFYAQAMVLAIHKQ